jgi:hypothetical protein
VWRHGRRGQRTDHHTSSRDPVWPSATTSTTRRRWPTCATCRQGSAGEQETPGHKATEPTDLATRRFKSGLRGPDMRHGERDILGFFGAADGLSNFPRRCCPTSQSERDRADAPGGRGKGTVQRGWPTSSAARSARGELRPVAPPKRPPSKPGAARGDVPIGSRWSHPCLVAYTGTTTRRWGWHSRPRFRRYDAAWARQSASANVAPCHSDASSSRAVADGTR